MIQGIDVSRWEDNALDWKQVGGKFSFAFIKASEGTMPDPWFARQWQASRGNILRGAYHFFRPGVNAATAAFNFVGYLKSAGDFGELPAVLDLETADGFTPTTVMNQARKWVEIVKAETGKAPIIYTRAILWKDLGGAAQAWAAECPLWVAQYPYDLAKDFWTIYREVLDGKRKPDYPAPFAPFKKAHFWQWTQRGKPEDVPGYTSIKKQVDFNFWNGTLGDLLAFSGVSIPAPTPAPAPAPAPIPAPALTDAEKLARLWNAHPELHKG